jgi:uncharacterized membrane protein
MSSLSSIEHKIADLYQQKQKISLEIRSESEKFKKMFVEDLANQDHAKFELEKAIQMHKEIS